MRTRSFLLSAPFFLLPVANCSISTHVQYLDAPAGTRPYDRTTPGGQYEAALRVDGVDLDVSVTEEALCTRGQIRSVYRTEHRLRKAHPSPWALVLPGVALSALGAGIIFGGPTIVSEIGFSAPTASPETYQIAGGAVVATGVGLMLGGAIHAIRARDSQRELGIVEVPELITASCRAAVSPGIAGTLYLSDTQTLRATVDGASKLHFSMLDVGSGLLPTSSTQLPLRIAAKQITVALSSEQAQLLRRGLLADARSSARQELLAQQQEQCSQAFRHAQEFGIPSTRAQAASGLTALELADTTCGSLFSTELAELRAKVQQAEDRFKAEDAFFAAARTVSTESTVEELTGKVVHIEKSISSTDEQGGYIRFESEQVVCLRPEATPRLHWGRGRGGGGRGGSHWWGGGKSHGGNSWFRSKSSRSSYRSKPSKRWYHGSSNAAPLDSEDSEIQEDTIRTERKPRCQTKKKVVLVFRLLHPTPHRLKIGDFVKVYATATPSGRKDTMYLVGPRIVMLTRENQTLISQAQ